MTASEWREGANTPVRTHTLITMCMYTVHYIIIAFMTTGTVNDFSSIILYVCCVYVRMYVCMIIRVLLLLCLFTYVRILRTCMYLYYVLFAVW